MKPRFESQQRTRVVTAEQFAQGFDVVCGQRFMRVGYQKIATYNDGSVLVVEPQWRDGLVV